jgi:hypothetical protein
MVTVKCVWPVGFSDFHISSDENRTENAAGKVGWGIKLQINWFSVSVRLLGVK